MESKEGIEFFDIDFSIPEQKLWHQVLLVALSDIGITKYKTTAGTALYKKDLRRGAIAWFSSNSNDAGAFLWVCSILGIDKNKTLRLVDEAKKGFTCEGRSRRGRKRSSLPNA